MRPCIIFRRPTTLWAALLILSSVPLVACRSQNQRQRTELLPEASPGERNFSKYEPERPYAELAPGLLSRHVAEAEGPDGIHIEVRDLLVPPGKKAENISFPGAAVEEVLYGEGLFVSGGKSQQLQVGSTLGLSQGDSFSLENRGELPLVIRVRLFEAR